MKRVHPLEIGDRSEGFSERIYDHSKGLLPRMIRESAVCETGFSPDEKQIENAEE